MNPPCIAVVDDDPAVLDMTELLLALEGYRPVGFLTAPLDLTCIDGGHPDLVIVDLHLERREAGLAVAAALRTDRATAHIPLGVWSADPEVERMVRSHHLEGVVVRVKPVLAADLLHLIANLMPATGARVHLRG